MVIRKIKTGSLVFFLVLMFLITFKNVYAAGGVISQSPQTGNYSVGQVFSVSTKIDGGGSPFNAAKATVNLSANLAVNDLTLGDCGFAFVKTPTKDNPSFTGVILGGSTNNCTLYTLNVRALSAGNASVSFSDASIKSYPRANEILSSAQSSFYNIGQPLFGKTDTTSVATSQPGPTTAPQVGSNGLSYYTISFTTTLPRDIPPASVKIVLDPKQSNETVFTPPQNQNASNTVTATFENVPQGIHTIAVNDVYGKPIAKQVLNAEGTNKSLVFGTSIKPPATPIWVFIIPAIILILVVLSGGFAFWYLKFRAKSV